MQAIALGKKSCLEVTLFELYNSMCDLFTIAEETEFVSYANDNTPFVSEVTPENARSIYSFDE